MGAGDCLGVDGEAIEDDGDEEDGLAAGVADDDGTDLLDDAVDVARFLWDGAAVLPATSIP